MDEYVISDKRQQFWLMAVVCAVACMITFDYSSLNITLPLIANYFGVKVGVVAWLPTIYLLIITSALLGFGKLGDNIGYKKVFLAGLLCFILGGLGCVLAPNFPLLFTFRIFQSLGQAMYSPICIALLTYYLPANMKGRALGLYATMQGLGMAGGPALGGFTASTFGWRAVFFLPLPLALLIALLGWKILPGKQAKAADTRFDLLGAALLFVGLAGFIYAMNTGARAGWTDALVLNSMAAAATAFLLFFLREKKVAYPLLDLNLFRNLNFTFAALAALTALAMNIGMGFLFPFFLQMMIHLPVAQTGLLLMTSSVMSMLLSPFAGTLSDRIGSRRLCIIGMVLAAAAFMMMSFFSAQTNVLYIILALICMGTGMGCFTAPNNRLLMQNAPADKQGVASGIYKIALNGGSSIGIAAYILVMAQVVISNASKPHLDGLMAGFRGTFIFGMVLALVALTFSFLARDKA